MASQQQATVQGVTQVSLLGQFQVRLLDQVLRRLAGHTDGQYTYEMTEDVFSRGEYAIYGQSLKAHRRADTSSCEHRMNCLIDI